MQERRRLLAELRRKYGEDLGAVMAYAREGAARLAALHDAEGEAARLQAEHELRRAELREAEAAVRSVRARAAGQFGRLVGERLASLAMAGARLEVHVAPEGTGEPVELALGANLGEPVQPLARAASGGELARAMLAIRLVGLGGPQTMVFDEVDAGVGGAAALALGEALHEVGRQRQVLVVTHLAQVASRADAQISVVKRESRGRTVTTAVTGVRRGACHRAVTDAVGPSRQRRGPCPCPRAAAGVPCGVVHRASAAFDYRGRVHRSLGVMLDVPKAA